MPNEVNEIDESLADWLAGGQFDPDFQYSMKKRELDKDNRINKPERIDVNSKYLELQEYMNSNISQIIT